jgi:Tfp pilus assembly protein PilV
MKNWRTSGLTLIEVLLATVIVVTVGLSLSVFAPRAIKSIAKIHTRSVATSLASTRVEDTKARPYAVIPVTPDGPYFSGTSPIGACDCSSVDFTQPIPSSETVSVGQIAYTRQTCINYVRKTILGTWQSNCTNDTGVKQIVTNISWRLGSEAQSVTMQSLASPPAQYGTLLFSTATFAVTVCAADGNMPPACTGVNPTVINGAEVSVTNASFTGENAGGLPPNPAIITVPAGTGYTIHVQKVGFFPYYSPTTFTIVSGQNIPLTVVLRDIATYGSKLAGEAFVADHPVISKVYDAYGQPGGCSATASSCNNASEALEIYNPTTSTFTIGTPDIYPQLAVQFCNKASGVNGACITPDFTQPPFSMISNPLHLNPGSYILIVGKDPNYGIPTEWGIGQQGDITYDPTVAGSQIAAGQTVGLLP